MAETQFVPKLLDVNKRLSSSVQKAVCAAVGKSHSRPLSFLKVLLASTPAVACRTITINAACAASCACAVAAAAAACGRTRRDYDFDCGFDYNSDLIKPFV
jgi:hypothetical protein